MPLRVKITSTRNAQRKRYYAKHRKCATNSFRRWSLVERIAIFERKMFDVELSKMLGRSAEAIQVMRCKLS